MKRDHVTPHEGFSQRNTLHPEFVGVILRQVGVKRDGVHAERPSPIGHGGTNATRAQERQRLPTQLDPREAGAIPISGPHGTVGPHDLAGHREHEAYRQLRHRGRAALRRVDHRNATFGRNLEIDIVHAHSGAAHHPQIGRSLKELPGDLRGTPNDEALRPGHCFLETFGLPARGDQDLEALITRQRFESRQRNLVHRHNQEPLLAHMSTSVRASSMMSSPSTV